MEDELELLHDGLDPVLDILEVTSMFLIVVAVGIEVDMGNAEGDELTHLRPASRIAIA